MNLPGPDDYIDIHDHEGTHQQGVYRVENLMAHEVVVPDTKVKTAYTYGIHPWYLTKDTFNEQIERVRVHALHSNVIAIGEGGFDRLRGPEHELQKNAFEEQAAVAEKNSKPLFIHCVRAWDDLLESHKRIRPSQPWLIHGFRGKKDLGLQLISKRMYISFWFEFILRPESGELLRSLPRDRIFLETDGSGADIRVIYNKAAGDLGIEVEKLKGQIFSNYGMLFNL